MSETLFDKIGGMDAVNAAVDIFYTKVLVDDRIKHYFETTDMDKQRNKQKAFLAFAFGGPVQYDGLDMRKAHEGMNLTEEHFGAVAENLVNTLKELNVAQEHIDEVVTVALSVKDDVLGV